MIKKENRVFVPGLTINVTDYCNFKCEYCPPYGENLAKGTAYDENATLLLIDLAKKYDIKQVRFTGGEPFIMPDRLKVFLQSSGSSFRRLVVNTNGSKLHENFDWLVDYRNQIVLKISLDTLNEEKYNEVTKGQFFEAVYRNINTAIQKSFDIELNVVLFKQTYEELANLVEFAVRNMIDVKFLTISSFYGKIDPMVSNANSYVNVKRLVDYLSLQSRDVSHERLVGERGAPMLVYKVKSSKFTIFDHRTKDCITPLKCYFYKCEHGCSMFPCDHGAFSITLSTDGLITVCRGKKDWSKMVFFQNSKAIESAFMWALKQFQKCFEIDVNTIL